MSATKPMTGAETADLARLEAVIEAGRKGLVREQLDIARALLEINDRGLFRGSHKNISGYCLERWGYGKTHCYNLISWAREAVENSAIAELKEGQARELKGLPAEVQKLVLETVPEATTAAEIKTVLEEFKALPAEEQKEALKRDAKRWTPPATGPRDGMREAESQCNRLLGRAFKVCQQLGPAGEKKLAAIQRAIDMDVAAAA